MDFDHRAVLPDLRCAVGFAFGGNKTGSLWKPIGACGARAARALQNLDDSPLISTVFRARQHRAALWHPDFFDSSDI